jgi:hypothetical protein
MDQGILRSRTGVIIDEDKSIKSRANPDPCLQSAKSGQLSVADSTLKTNASQTPVGRKKSALLVKAKRVSSAE